MTRRPDNQRSGPSRDVEAGLLAGVTSFAVTVPLGVVILSPFGTAGASFGATAALVAAVLGGLLIPLLGPARTQIAGPCTLAAVILWELSSWLAAQPGIGGGAFGLVRALPFLLGVVALAGLMQLAAAVAGLTRHVQHLPVPVMAGFSLMLGLGLILSSWPDAIGLTSGDPLSSPWSPPRIGAMAAFWATIAGYAAARRLRTRVSPLLVAFAAGMAAATLAYLTTGAETLPHAVLRAQWPSTPLPSLDWGAAVAWIDGPMLLHCVLAALALAIVASHESLSTLLAGDLRSGADSDPARQLWADGLANIAVALTGGVSVSASSDRTAVVLDLGARRRVAPLVAAAVVGLGLLADDPGALLPPPVMNGLIAALGLTLLDGRIGAVLRDLIRPLHPQGAGNFLVMLVTAVAVLLFGPALGVLAGLGLAMVRVLHRISRPLTLRELTGRQRRSRRTRPPEQAEFLFTDGMRTRILEPEGALTAASADQIRHWLAARAGTSPLSLILNLSRLAELDAAGAQVLGAALRRYLGHHPGSVALVGLARGDAAERLIGAAGLAGFCPVLADLDAALEWAENRLLAHAPDTVLSPLERQIPLADMASTHQIRDLERFLAYRVVEAGDVIFRQGDPGDALYFLEEGAIRIEWSDGPRRMRLATLSPGVVFGEMSLIDGAPRSATALAEERSIILKLTKDALDRIMREDPQLAMTLLRGLAADMARRLRLANAALAEVTT